MILSDFNKSLKHALRGIALVYRTERNFRLQAVAAVLIIFASFALPLDLWRQVVLLLITAAVLILEIFNSILERFADAVHPRIHPIIRDIKDLTAGVVLIASAVAVVLGLLLLFEPLQSWVYDIIRT